MSGSLQQRWYVLAAIVGLASFAVPGRAEAFSCGNKLVHEGDTAGEVAAKCGQPNEVSRKSILRPPITWRYGRPYRVPGGDVEVVVEFWTYNLGPNKFMRRLRIEDGEVKQIETLGYGYL